LGSHIPLLGSELIEQQKELGAFCSKKCHLIAPSKTFSVKSILQKLNGWRSIVLYLSIKLTIQYKKKNAHSIMGWPDANEHRLAI
jgi:hypothetical protein